MPAAKHLTTDELADRLGISKRTIEGWRRTGEGPQFLPLLKGIRYREVDIEAWEKSRLVTPGT